MFERFTAWWHRWRQERREALHFERKVIAGFIHEEEE